MAKRNFSSAVDLSLNGRNEVPSTNTEILKKDNYKNEIIHETEAVNDNMTTMSLSNNNAEIKTINGPLEKNNEKNKEIDNDINVLTEDNKIEKNIKSDEEIKEIEEKSSESKILTTPPTYLSVKEEKKEERKEERKKDRGICVSSWLPSEYKEAFDAAAILYKNSAQYVCKLIERDLNENGERYISLTEHISNFKM